MESPVKGSLENESLSLFLGRSSFSETADRLRETQPVGMFPLEIVFLTPKMEKALPCENPFFFLLFPPPSYYDSFVLDLRL